MTVRERLTGLVQAALASLYDQNFLQGTPPTVVLMPPKQASHGDFSCTVALALAKAAGKNPRAIATELQKALGNAEGLCTKTEIAGPGYLNMLVADVAWHGVLASVLKTGEKAVHSNRGKGERVLLEYVSANPTGPLHVAHGRGAVTGDVMANMMDAAGFKIEREYYVNDLGNQADVMARSVYLRYAELCGRPLNPPEDFYPGEYITEMAKDIHANVGQKYLDKPEAEWLDVLRDHGIAAMLTRIKSDLAAFGVRFDHFVSERELTARVGLDSLVKRLEKSAHIYEDDGKKWFRSTDFGDDKDRVVVREDGRPTYFASDIAYHDEKLQRGFSRLVNVWGADHGGYLARVKAGLSALGYDASRLHVVFIQMVSLSRGGEAVRMGKRLGTAVWLREIIDEAGKDATRYFFLMRRSEAQMDFDIELATKKSIENPVFYAQMGHARLASIQRKAQESGTPLPTMEPGILDALTLPEELDLIKSLARAPDVVGDAAVAMEPHQVVHYLQGLIAQFHSYYSQYKNTERVISDDKAKTAARLLLCEGLRLVLKALLVDILGVDAPERMHLSDTDSNEAD